MGRYVALLRGINVGGKNLIKMVELQACFVQEGFEDVVTYIQSGNVLFTTKVTGRDKLIRRIESSLVKTFDCRASVVLRSSKQMQDIVGRAPDGFGERPARYRYDVIFLKEPLTASSALEKVPVKPGVDEVHAGTGVLYFSRLISRITSSQISRMVSMPIYKNMTIRNWNTTTKLMKMMAVAPAPR